MLMMPEIGRIIAGRYEISEKLGSGGMSVVYKAMDKKLNRAVSFKVLREELAADEEFLERFMKEAHSVASLNHANIVNVYDVGHDQDSGINYIVMEYIDGLTLKELICKRAPFSDTEVLGVSIQVAAALLHAHNAGIIHRDIKPQNVLVTERGAVKVTDFGIAGKPDTNTVSINAEGTTMGSVHYFSPEQAKGGRVDQKSDLYSLGIMMYEMLTGELPFDADTNVSIALKHINEPLPEIRKTNAKVSENVERIVIRLTKKNPDKRYPNAYTLLKDLRAVIANPNGKPPAKTAPANESGETVVITKEELNAIGKELELSQTDVGEAYAVEAAGTSDAGFDKPLDDNGGEEEPPENRRIEKNIIIGAVAAAIVIVAAIMFFVYPRLIQNKISGVETAITVPELVGTLFEDSETELSALGLKLKLAGETYSDEFEAGVITEANYKEGAILYPGDEVSVIVSLGTDKIKIPDLTGGEYKTAYEKITGLPFTIKDNHVFSDDYPIGTVFDQEPKPGELTEPGTVITIFISKGKEYVKVVVPNLLGLTEEQAYAELKNRGLKVGNVTRSNSTAFEIGRVMLQTVKSGDEVIMDTIVGLVISSGPPQPTPTPASPAQPTASPGANSNEGNGQDNDGANSGKPSKTIRITDLGGLDLAAVRITTYVDSFEVTVFEKLLTKEELPYNVTVTGEGDVVFNLYINGVMNRQMMVEFGDGA